MRSSSSSSPWASGRRTMPACAPVSFKRTDVPACCSVSALSLSASVMSAPRALADASKTRCAAGADRIHRRLAPPMLGGTPMSRDDAVTTSAAAGEPVEATTARTPLGDGSDPGSIQSPIDFEAEGLLDGLDERHRAERLGLLRQLVADGVPLAELRRRSIEGTVMFLPAERVLAGGERYTAEQIAEQTGVDLDFLVSIRRAMGMPIPGADEAVYTKDELESVQMT